MTAAVIDASNELGFKVNTYKMISLLDTSPTLPKIRDYVRFLRGKSRDLQNQEVTKPKKELQTQVKTAALKGDSGGKGGKSDYKGKGGKEGGKKGKGDGKAKGKGAGKDTGHQCTHFLSDHGCNFGKTCNNVHARLEASQGKCFNCGGTDHITSVCTRPRAQQQAGAKGGGRQQPTIRALQDDQQAAPQQPQQAQQPVRGVATMSREERRRFWQQRYARL